MNEEEAMSHGACSVGYLWPMYGESPRLQLDLSGEWITVRWMAPAKGYGGEKEERERERWK